jgi:hypothetical protein
MGFYLRKGFNFGPIRINLSKSGLGFSAGVTGARIGINSKGQTYVHGGRHGLYYRKTLSGGSSSGSSSFSGRTYTPYDQDEDFVDTGYTYLQQPFKKQDVQLPPLEEQKENIGIVIAVILIFLALFLNPLSIQLSLVGIALGIIIWQVVKALQWKKFLKNTSTLQDLSVANQNEIQWKMYTSSMNEAQLKTAGVHCAYSWLENQIMEGVILPIQELQKFLPVEKSVLDQIKSIHYSYAVEVAIADHELSEEEEAYMKEIANKWVIPEEIIQQEMAVIHKFKHLRELHEKPLLPISTLSPTEELYLSTYGRLLNLRIIDTWQSGGIRYKSRGYKVEMEGELEITSKSILVKEGRNSRSFAFHQIEDIYLSEEKNVLEIFIKNRKSPIILTSPDLIEFTTILNKLIDNPHQND